MMERSISKNPFSVVHKALITYKNFAPSLSQNLLKDNFKLTKLIILCNLHILTSRDFLIAAFSNKKNHSGKLRKQISDQQ